MLGVLRKDFMKVSAKITSINRSTKFTATNGGIKINFKSDVWEDDNLPKKGDFIIAYISDENSKVLHAVYDNKYEVCNNCNNNNIFSCQTCFGKGKIKKHIGLFEMSRRVQFEIDCWTKGKRRKENSPKKIKL